MFAHRLGSLPVAGEQARETVVAVGFVRRDHGRAETEEIINEPVAGEIAEIEPAGEACHRDDGELEALALVNADEADAVSRGRGRGIGSLLESGLCIEVLDEAKETVSLEVVELACEG